jgi:5-methylcytosine-specific restriction endonuclease McrA
MSHVFVVDADKQPLNPVHPGQARIWLSSGKAAVLKRYPFTLILKTRVEQPQGGPLRLKLDPGSKTTGIALVDDPSGEVVFAAELVHRGMQIKERLDKRRGVRRSKRSRKTRYRKARFQNRRRPKGWLPPSLESRVVNILTWVGRLRRSCPIRALSMELVRFDMQAMENPDIEGCQYQQGTLAGYEVREYLLEKWGRKCVYCSKQNIPLQIEHIVPRARGGTDRVSNLTLSCEPCNLAKGTKPVKDFLQKKPEVLKQLLTQAKAPLKDASAVNATRWQLYHRLLALGLPVECGSGGLTKFNRTTRGLPKQHWIDAACVGKSTPEKLKTQGIVPLFITAQAHGRRQMCNVDKRGFARSKPKAAKKVRGFQTGDMVRAQVTTGKKRGQYVGRVLVRASESFDITTRSGRIQGLDHRFCTPVHRRDGYGYAKGTPYADSPTLSSCIRKGHSSPG